MAESSLSVSWDKLRRLVGRKWGWDTNPDNWSEEQVFDSGEIIDAGYRTFIQPRPVGGPPHEWSFMKPVFQLVLPDGEADVDLPAEFGSLVGDLYYIDAANASMCPLKRRNDGQVLMRRQQTTSSTGRPEWCAIVPNSGPTVSKGQRFRLMLWPTPDQEYTVQGRCTIHPEALGPSHPYPWGGMAQAECLIQACLAASEYYYGAPGVSVARFAECLAAAIEHDRRVGPQVIDNLDGRRSKFLHGGPFDPSLGTITTYNGLYN